MNQDARDLLVAAARPLVEKLERLCADLGDSPDAIAAFLEGQGIKGFRMSAFQCPVAIYLSRATGVRIGVASYIGENERNDIVPPGPVSKFVQAFDVGYYPQLGLEPEEGA